MSSVLEALETLYQYRTAREKSMAEETESETWLDPARPLTNEELRQLAAAVYAVMRAELRIERERHCGF
jgi:hypothetical protein